MTERDFRTAAEARAAAEAERLRAAETAVERVKRAVESALESYPRGSLEHNETLRYCARIGLEVATSPGAGVEFRIGPLGQVAEKIDAQPMPAALARHAS